jgi:Holliday junction resolvase RusA-like endonuclease
MPSKKVVIKKVPHLNWAVAMWGGKPVPTKQEKYKPLTGYQGVLNEGETEEIFEELYIRNPDKNIVHEFENRLREYLKENTTSEMPYKMPLEVILAFDINRKRLFEVDVDNLCKTVLDAMKGIIFEDDSQVVRLLALKDTHEWDTNGLSIGVNKIEKDSDGWFRDLKMFYIEEIAEPEIPNNNNQN